MLSQPSKMLYGYNITLDLTSDHYRLITGSGMDRTVEIYKGYEEFTSALDEIMKYVDIDYREALSELLDGARLSAEDMIEGFCGSMEYPVLYPGAKKCEWQEINIFCGRARNGTPLVNILGRDITEQHELQEARKMEEEKMRNKLAMADAANRAKSAFLFNMSHDIRTPLNAIIGFTDIAEKCGDDIARRDECRSKIKIASLQLLDILNNVLEMARIENGRIVIDEEAVDRHQLIDSILAVFEGEIKKKNMTLKTDFSLEYPYLYMDRTHMSEIFLNVISNAIKYTPEGGVISLSSREVITDRDNICLVEAVIEDNGIGMSEEFLEHAFEMFARERTATESKVQGTGLGLAIVKNLIDLMHGTIDIESQMGQGSKITICIPHRIADKPVKRCECHDMSSCGCGRRILLAEDNEMNREIACALLEDKGYWVDTAEDGTVVLKLIEDRPAEYYECILMDIQMPMMDGYKTTEAIRQMKDEDKASLPIIAMTANAFAEDRKRAIQAGMNAHVSKPIDVELLMKTISRVLNARGIRG